MAAPLDAERARLRALGLTEAEVSQVLINQASGVGSQQPAGAVPVQGNMSGVLGNASAVFSHARGAIPAIKADLGNLSDSTASAKLRSISALKLAGVAAIVAVLVYAIHQEWQQHIVSATAMAAAQAQKAEAEATAAKAVAEASIAKARYDCVYNKMIMSEPANCDSDGTAPLPPKQRRAWLKSLDVTLPPDSKIIPLPPDK